jgi:flagellar basal body-associated protein FliL
MRCPKCDSENNDSAKFCKKCGAPLKQGINHENMINSMNNKSGGDNTTKYIIVALVIVVIVLAGAFVYIYSSGSNQSASDSQPQQQVVDEQDDDDEPAQAQSSEPAQATSTKPKAKSMSILGGSFSTGSAEEDKTYASINVGKEHAGEDIVVQIFYSRDGNTLNNGNMVPVTVHSDGYVELTSADAYHYYPDHATINIFDTNNNLLTTKSVNLSPESGTQTF